MRKSPTLGLLSATLLILALAAPLTAQITFQRTYGRSDDEEGWSVTPTADGGYVIAGETWSYGAGLGDAWLIKTDANGDTMWTRAHGGTSYDYGRSVWQTADGGYVIAGYTQSYGTGRRDVWLIKTDASGDTIWTRTYGGTDDEFGYSVAQTADGGYVIAGCTNSFGAGDADVWLLKTDASGDTIWTRTYGGTGHECGYSVAQTVDGGYIIAGHTEAIGICDRDVYLVKTDASGDTIWTRTYGGTAWDRSYSAQQTADGGYVIAGLTVSFGAGHGDVWLLKTDALGDTIWTRTYGGAGDDLGNSAAQTTDGGYIIAGWTRSFGAGNADVWLIKTDASGDTMWTRTYGGTNDDEGWSVAQTTDGGYVIAGWTESFGAGDRDFWLIKTDSAGRVAIAEPEPPVAFEPVSATIVRGVLNLQSEICNLKSEFVLLNSAGRKVMALQPGENDVRHLSPGIYFVRPASSVERQASSVHKVILTR